MCDTKKREISNFIKKKKNYDVRQCNKRKMFVGHLLRLTTMVEF